MERYLDEAAQAVLLLWKCLLIYLVYFSAKSSVKKDAEFPPTNWAYVIAPILAIFFAVIAATSYGRGSEDGDFDYIIPTTEDRIERFVYVFTASVIPACFGVYRGIKEYWGND